jgi:hypothetical protein
VLLFVFILSREPAMKEYFPFQSLTGGFRE